MFIKPDYNLKNVYEIDFEELKAQGLTDEQISFVMAMRLARARYLLIIRLETL